jgi:hypothetical protein
MAVLRDSADASSRGIFQPHAPRQGRQSPPIARAYLLRYAQEASWREDDRRLSNGEQVNRLAGLVSSKAVCGFRGYWQRHISKGRPTRM